MEANNTSQPNDGRMSYEELMERGLEAQLRGNEELAKALFERAKDIDQSD